MGKEASDKLITSLKAEGTMVILGLPDKKDGM